MSNKIEVGFNAEVRSALKQFADAKALAKQADEMKAQAEAILRSALGGNTEATVGGVSAFKIESRTRTNISAEVLKTEYPEAYEAAKSVSQYDFIKVV
jgi:hypothetical protein